MNRFWIMLLMLAIGLTFAIGVKAEASREEVVAAVPSDFPPYYQVDSQGRPYGHSIDVMKRLADEAQLHVRYVVRPDWQSTMDALRKGEADLIPGLGITPERLLDFDFTTPLETLALGIFVRSENTRIHGIEGLAGVNTAVVRQNAAVAWIRTYPQIKAREFQTQEQALFALLSGEVDALIYPITVTWRMASAIGLEGRIRQAGLPLVEIKRAVAVRKGNNALLQRLDEAVREYTRSEDFGPEYARAHAMPRPFWTAERLLRYAAGFTLLALGLAMATLLWWHRRQVAELTRRLAECRTALESAKRERNQTDSGPT